ncbi:hypothetical protein [Euzebya sp.]|uniref:hypothetical protein n=1 Tax=Euzebya sp. TaxID=1971409 RepID=UPI003516A6C5
MAQLFTSIALDPAVRGRLIATLSGLHAERPLSAADPRDAVGRLQGALDALGLDAVRIRGAVGHAGVEVDHVWLAVRSGPGGPWVLDAAFPLHQPTFLAALSGYVAGTTTREELDAIARRSRIEDRVIGELPARTTYRGRPYWGTSAN